MLTRNQKEVVAKILTALLIDKLSSDNGIKIENLALELDISKQLMNYYINTCEETKTVLSLFGVEKIVISHKNCILKMNLSKLKTNMEW